MLKSFEKYLGHRHGFDENMELWCKKIGISKAVVDMSTNFDYHELGHQFSLPFERGTKLKLQTPFMEKPIFGTFDSYSYSAWQNHLYLCADDSFPFKNVEMIPLMGEAKLTRLDVFCTLSSGEKADLEVQVVNHKNMGQRSLYYWAQMYLMSCGKVRITKHCPPPSPSTFCGTVFCRRKSHTLCTESTTLPTCTA